MIDPNKTNKSEKLLVLFIGILFVCIAGFYYAKEQSDKELALLYIIPGLISFVFLIGYASFESYIENIWPRICKESNPFKLTPDFKQIFDHFRNYGIAAGIFVAGLLVIKMSGSAFLYTFGSITILLSLVLIFLNYIGGITIIVTLNNHYLLSYFVSLFYTVTLVVVGFVLFAVQLENPITVMQDDIQQIKKELIIEK